MAISYENIISAPIDRMDVQIHNSLASIENIQSIQPIEEVPLRRSTRHRRPIILDDFLVYFGKKVTVTLGMWLIL